MNPSLFIFSSVIIVSLVSLVGVFTLSFSEKILRRALFLLVSIAAGALLGDAFYHLIPEAFEKTGNPALVSSFIIFGILFFFVLEKFLHWHHSHSEEECADNERAHGMEKSAIHPLGYLILVSDGLHNFLDGLIIAASYLVSVEIGIATTLAIILHEIPQEIGDFGILLHAGFRKMQALFLNFLSALLAVLGASLVLIFNEIGAEAISWLIPLAAGGFIYIASADLIPELHKTKEAGLSVAQFGAMVLGVLLVLSLRFLE
ncbi:MAG: ZIP family metal transporter [Parcubacteria group bacterium]|nr:ZIP family metal transporter [Parcubacteria group bacterium]